MRHPRAFEYLSLGALYALLLWAPLAAGAYRGWPLVIAHLLTLLGLLAWVLGMVADRSLTWRRTALDLPLALLVALVSLQLALGNRPLAAWALAPPAANPELPVALPTAFFALGTVSPAGTAQSLLLFLTYAGVYVLVVNLIRERQALDRLVLTLLFAGGLLAFLGLLDYLSGGGGFLRWSGEPARTGRLSGTFVNPDHFAAWLAMLVCLGLGYLAARRRSARRSRWGFTLLRSRESREHLFRQYLPFVGVGVMAVAIVFTLSRGGILSLLLALVVLLAFLGALGRARWGLVLVGVLLAVVLGYGFWIGLEPFLARVWQSDFRGRWLQTLTTLPMLSAFPFLGVGLGAYKEIYFRYQPAALAPGKVYFPYAHNDLLQLAVELGLVGAALCLFAAWQVGRDLLAVHLFGRGRCPVGGGEHEGARRSDPFSIGIALGAVGGVLALLFHSGFDFSARIPANGILASACLGIATVALHTRFTTGGEEVLSAVRTCSLGNRRFLPVVAGVMALALSLAAVPTVLRPVLVEAKLRAASGPGALHRVEEALAVDPWDVRALAARARLKLDAARDAWNSGVAPGGALLGSPEARQSEALALANDAIEDLRGALSLAPSDPFLHEQLGWAYGTAAVIDSSHPAEPLSAALTHLQRAIALAPENPFLYRSLAALAVAQREPLLQIGLSAARSAVQRDPGLLPDLVDRLLPLALREPQWLALVPEAALARLELAALLEARGLLTEAGSVYRRAVELAQPGEESLFRWMHARLLMRRGDHRGAVVELEAALKHDPENPQLHLARAHSLAALGDPKALDAYRGAVASAEARANEPGRDSLPFQVTSPRAEALALERLGPGESREPLRYRRALAQHLTERKLWDQAFREWEAVLSAAPSDPEAHFSRGLILDHLGARDQALQAYQKAVSLDGRVVRFRLRLAQRFWEADQYYQAINEWRTVTAQEPGNVEAHVALARAYLKVGEQVEALRAFQRARLLAPDHPEVRGGLARLGRSP